MLIPFGFFTSGGGFDEDAQAFFDAAGISDETQQNAINTLVESLKEESLWSKFHAIYPFVGGTATTHKYNLVDPQDTDGAFRLNFVNSPTHSANGVKFGSPKYADTFLTPSVTMSLNSAAIGFYNRDDISGSNQSQMGVWTSGGILIYAREAASPRVYQNSTTGGGGNTNASADGMTQAIRTISTEYSIIRDGALNKTNTFTANKLGTGSIFLGCTRINASPSQYIECELAFAYISSGLSIAEAITLYDLVQTYQTSLSRQV